MVSKINFHPKKLSLVIATILGVNLNTSYATLLNYNIITESGYAIGQTTPLINSSTHSDPASSSVYLDYNSYGQDPNTRGAAAGNDYGWMYSRSGGQGSYFTHYSVVTQTVDLQNDSAFDQDYNYNFAINFGSLSAYNFSFNTALEYSMAGYEVEISVNNTALWQSSFTLTTDLASGSVGSGSGVSLAAYSEGNNYFSWPEYSGNLGLGLLGSGQSLTLSYSIKTFVAGNHAASCNGYGSPAGFSELEEDCNGYGYGGYGSYGYLNFSGDTYAQFGDPNSFSGTPVAFNNQNITPQREVIAAPGTLALAGLGLAGLAFRRRKQQS
ncbi:hypothetical protein A5320_14475 [Rheinheimera sp. SA_1]|nr:hypothetical protein A5320_14475 [Rheinheimera sp. SA_1]